MASAASADVAGSAAPGAAGALIRRAARDARVRTLSFAYLFIAVGFINPSTYASLYPTVQDRMSFSASFSTNKAVVIFYGKAYNLLTAGGYAAWRTGGTLALFAAVFGIFAAVRATRAEEDAGRAELVLARVVGRRTVFGSSLAAIAGSIALLWLAETIGLLLAGLGAGGSAYLALATVSVAAVFVGIGSIVSQLAPTRRGAVQLGLAVFVVTFLLRIVADTSSGFAWLSWATPLGWAEEMRPFTGAQPAVLLLPVAATVILVAVAARIYGGRDIGAGLLPGRDSAVANPRLLGSPTAHALREERGSLLIWMLSLAAVGLVVGLVSKAVNSTVISPSLERELAKFGALQVATPRGYISFAFILVVPAIAAFMCSQVAAARKEEEEERLETLFAMPVSRAGWLLGRLSLAVAGGVVIALSAGIAAWVGAQAAGVNLSLVAMLEASANCLPVAVLFLGIAALAYALWPRPSAGIAYGLLAIAFLWYLFGSLVSVPKWVVNATPFAHVAAVPVEPFRWQAASLMVAGGLVAAGLATIRFVRRDLLGS